MSRAGTMSGWWPLAVTVVLLAAANIGAHLLFPRAGLAVNAVLLVALVGVAWWTGLSAEELGLGRAHLATGIRWSLWILAGALVVFAVALAIPWVRQLVGGAPPDGAPWLRILITIPLGTVLVEEFAFRGVLWALLCRDHGPVWATYGSAVLFGLWHALAALGGGSANATLDSVTGGGLTGTFLKVAGTVVFTFVVGVLFAELRARSGSLLPAASLHWAANGLGVLFIAVVA